jgi:hypothetical protein
MTNRFRVTTAKLLLAAAAIVPAFAHSGFDHIRGTVAKVANNVLTIKTDHGNVDVKLDSRTNLIRNNHKAFVSDLKPGVRVITELPEGSKDRIAQSVRIGAAPKPALARRQTPASEVPLPLPERSRL